MGQGEVAITARDTWKRTTSSSSVHRLLVRPASGMTTISTCSPMALSSAASSSRMLHRSERRGCGRSSWSTTRIARRHTATRRRARQRWQHSLRAGDGNRPAGRAGNALDCTRLVRERVKITIWPQCDLIALTLSITHCVGSKVSQPVAPAHAGMNLRNPTHHQCADRRACTRRDELFRSKPQKGWSLVALGL
jgi:hypothetical protein